MDHCCFLFVGGGGRIRPCFPRMLSLVTVDKIIAPLLKKFKNSSEASSAIFYPEAAFIYQFICYGKRTRAPSWTTNGFCSTRTPLKSCVIELMLFQERSWKIITCNNQEAIFSRTCFRVSEAYRGPCRSWLNVRYRLLCLRSIKGHNCQCLVTDSSLTRAREWINVEETASWAAWRHVMQAQWEICHTHCSLKGKKKKKRFLPCNRLQIRQARFQ